MASKHCLSLVKFPISITLEALLCFTYAWNRICHKDGNKTPFEKYSGRKPSVLHLIPFGCLAYAGVPKQIRKKFDMRAKMGIMMGYAQRTKGYRIWLIDENKLVETINVRYIFDENKRGINFRQKVNSNLGYNLNLPDYYDDEDDFDRVKDSLTSRLVSKTSMEMPSTSEMPGVSSDNHNLIPCTEVKWIRNIGRGKKDNTESQGFSDLSEQQEALMVEVTIPNCYKQAIRSRDASKWHDAMDKEINVNVECVAAVAEWYRYRIMACFVTGSSPVPLKSRRVGQRCTLNLSRAETSSRWCGVVVRRGGASSGVVHVT
ncbi:gag_pre-integrs domain-containing protein [Trichonephila clavipes]|nr:gag_pre-integrs domain-containing protein [Trichonephila clavipes]